MPQLFNVALAKNIKRRAPAQAAHAVPLSCASETCPGLDAEHQRPKKSSRDAEAPLLSNAQLGEHIQVVLGIVVPYVVQQPTATSDHRLKTSASPVILGVCLHVFRQVIDPSRQNRNLNIRGTVVARRGCELLDQRRLLLFGNRHSLTTKCLNGLIIPIGKPEPNRWIQHHKHLNLPATSPVAFTVLGIHRPHQPLTHGRPPAIPRTLRRTHFRLSDKHKCQPIAFLPRSRTDATLPVPESPNPRDPRPKHE